MSITRRALALIGLTVAVLIGGSIPASATFSEAVAVATSVGTATIAPPTQVEAKTLCTTTVDPATQVDTTTIAREDRVVGAARRRAPPATASPSTRPAARRTR